MWIYMYKYILKNGTGSFNTARAVSETEVDRFNNFKNIRFSESICSHYIYKYKCENNRFVFCKIVHDQVYHGLIMPMLY